MWRNSLRDLQWRRRRFAIAVAAAALAFGMTMVLAGLAESFRAEARRVVDGVGADAWMVTAGANGPLTSIDLVPVSLATQAEGLEGVDRADAIAMVRQTIRVPAGLEDVMFFGHRPGGIGTPPVTAGRPPDASGEVAVDDSLGVGVGTRLEIAGRIFNVVGLTSGRTLYAGSPLVYALLSDVQQTVLFAQPVGNAIVMRGRPARAPAGYRVMTPDEVRADALRPLVQPIQTIDLVQALLWGMAALILGSVVYLGALERTRDFAVLKAVGTPSRQLLGGLALQSILLSVTAAVLAVGIGYVLAVPFPMPVEIPLRAIPTLGAVAVAVGVLAGAAGVRRALSAQPADAFGGP